MGFDVGMPAGNPLYGMNTRGFSYVNGVMEIELDEFVYSLDGKKAKGF